ncbi:CubicO group peptidase, beta-lactamase class C family [Reichenbachiella faecimaris]|uniref:CubicO group peptidase, beta-lactamase class C family n=1 Tax=Reichenbachiella faecimaris TaxID=692418 RepID=A0A1W2GKS2_REIFA|nr:serine hydrolase [Reichenbachiella faecimaris]SMD37154.1 CubicO group peptidase, beta-lactamase class C family [Reichenbachiella faecimaris]
MNLKYTPLWLASLVIFSCTEKSESFNTDELIGVWSGLLFQTESKYDSIVVFPAELPTEAILFYDGEKKLYPLVLNSQTLEFKGSSGLRFDAILPENSQTLKGIITNDLWAQSLTFEKVKDKWVSKMYKPEIIDTDYIVYLEFYKDSPGVVQANIQSNKENRKLHFTIKEVLIDGTNIDFEITNSRFGLAASYETENKNISLEYGNAGGNRKIQLTKLKGDELEGYFPRPINDKYEYKIPVSPDGLMQTASLDKVGINMSLLEFMDEANRGNLEHIHSVIITKDQKLVLEEYFHGYDREYLHDTRSAFKSIAALAVGKSMMQNSELEVENSILDYYPEYEIDDPQKNKITIHHALTMSTGIELEDEDKMQWDNNDWVGYKLHLPMKHEPGKEFEYSSGGSNLLTGVIEQSADTYLPLFVYKEILLPMGINKFQMLTSPKWRGYLAGNFYLRPIDFTKFGLLVLNKGKWNGEQLIAESWIEKSTKSHIKCSYPRDSDYGYLWRLMNRNVGGIQISTIEAWGNGGQFLIIIPELDMTVTFTSGNYNLFPEMERPFEILNNYILPAVILTEK